MMLAFLLFAGFNFALAQTRTISGIVTSSEDGSALPGVTVQVKGTTVGTTTDLDGKYVLKIQPNHKTLVFSFVGMKTREVAIDANGKLRNMGKYPTNANFDYDIPILRYEEVILNYAEALFELGDAANALTYLNMITSNRLANDYTEATKANIMQERRRELCFEGFRFDDLARTHSDIPLVSPLEQTHGGPAYGSYNFAFPIPIAEINANSNMVQNKGY